MFIPQSYMLAIILDIITMLCRGKKYYAVFATGIICITLISSCSNKQADKIQPVNSTYSATVSGTDLQIVKGWGVNVDNLNNSTAQKAELVDLGITIARIAIDHTECNADGSVTSSVMEKICNDISIIKSYGLSYIICSWSPNYAMKDNNGVSGAGKLLPSAETIFEDYWVNICNYIKNKGLALPTAISIQNEPTNGVSSYDGMGFQGQDSRDYSQYYRVVKAVRSKLDAAGFSDVKLLGPEEGSYCSGKNWGNALSFMGGVGFPALNNDATLKDAIWGCSAHSYYWGGTTADIAVWRDGCEAAGKDKWQTEFSDVETTKSTTWDYAIESTRRFCSDMAFVRNNYWMWWAASQGPYKEALLDGTYFFPLPAYYIFQKIWKNVPVGSAARSVSSTDASLVTSVAVSMDAVAFVNGNTTVVVLVNFTTLSRSTSVDGLTGITASIYQSSATQDMLLTGSSAVSSGKISSVTLPGKSVTVIVAK